VALNIAAALLPVLVFLVILYLMDSFKLVSPRAIAAALAAGAVCALAALALHAWLLPATGLSPRLFSRYVAPVTEEAFKAVYIVFVLGRRRLGFLVDAAILGFAVGTGFAVVENLDYLQKLADQRLVLWIVRGFGPALLHGTSTTLFAILAKSLVDRHAERWGLVVSAALVVAIAFHSLFNHFPMPPIVAACLLLVALPAIVTIVFGRSERATREWVGEGMDLDVALLGLLTSAEFGRTRLGSYLRQLRDRFPGPVVADMFCLLRIELELAIRAKGMLMARQEGVVLPPDPDVRARLEERRYLQRSIGATGLLALKPLRVARSRDDWHTYLLEQAGVDTFLGPFRRAWKAVRAHLGRRS
jgi:RsiW-degrading membrane proteinase PrsW (M82 family)